MSSLRGLLTISRRMCCLRQLTRSLLLRSATGGSAEPMPRRWGYGLSRSCRAFCQPLKWSHVRRYLVSGVTSGEGGPLYQCIPRAKRHRGLTLLETMVDAEVTFLLSGLYPEDILPIHTDRLIQAVLRQEHPRATTPERLGA